MIFLLYLNIAISRKNSGVNKYAVLKITDRNDRKRKRTKILKTDSVD